MHRKFCIHPVYSIILKLTHLFFDLLTSMFSLSMLFSISLRQNTTPPFVSFQKHVVNRKSAGLAVDYPHSFHIDIKLHCKFRWARFPHSIRSTVKIGVAELRGYSFQGICNVWALKNNIGRSKRLLPTAWLTGLPSCILIRRQTECVRQLYYSMREKNRKFFPKLVA